MKPLTIAHLSLVQAETLFPAVSERDRVWQACAELYFASPNGVFHAADKIAERARVSEEIAKAVLDEGVAAKVLSERGNGAVYAPSRRELLRLLREMAGKQ